MATVDRPHLQDIPRPPSARPGRPAPWAALPVPERRGIDLGRVLAGLAAADRTGEPPHATPAGPGASAVLVALFQEDGEARVVLTRRSAALRSHTGQVSFPGGRVDPGESPAEAAVREAAEEVSLDSAGVTVVGWLSPVVTFASGAPIQPVVATLDGRPALAANPAEVARVFDVALADLVAEGVFHEEQWSVPGRTVPGSVDGSFPVSFFEVAQETVWGATARVLFEFLSLVLDVAPHGG